MSAWLLASAVLTSVFATAAGARHLDVYAWLKPWPLLLMLLYFLSQDTRDVSSAALVGGALYLVFSWFGDVALLFKRKGFLIGLAAFLVAHWILIVHLYLLVQFTWHWGVPAFTGAGIAAFFIMRWFNLAQVALRVGIWVYALTLIMLLAVSVAVSINGPSLWRWSLVLASLFIFSDLLLAINRFKAPFASAQAWILSTYFTSQLGWTWIWAQQLLL